MEKRWVCMRCRTFKIISNNYIDLSHFWREQQDLWKKWRGLDGHDGPGNPRGNPGDVLVFQKSSRVGEVSDPQDNL